MKPQPILSAKSKYIPSPSPSPPHVFCNPHQRVNYEIRDQPAIISQADPFKFLPTHKETTNATPRPARPGPLLPLNYASPENPTAIARPIAIVHFWPCRLRSSSPCLVLHLRPAPGPRSLRLKVATTVHCRIIDQAASLPKHRLTETTSNAR